MSVPDTNTFALSDVISEIGLPLNAGTSLGDCFANANPAGFDPAYEGSKDRLSNFRNYDHSGGGVAWEVDTYSLTADELSVTENSPQGIFFKDDGTKMFITGNGTNRFYEYDLSPAWEVATATLVDNVNSGVSGVTAIHFKPDGLQYFYTSSNNDLVYSRTLTVAWDLSASGLLDSFDISNESTTVQGVFIKPDGTKMYILDSDAGDSVYQYTLSTPWSLSSAVYDNVSFSFTGQTNFPADLFFKPDGTKLYIVTGTTVYQYSLSTAWDISTLSYESKSLSLPYNNSNGLFFKSDGALLFTVGSTDDKVTKHQV